MIYVLHHQQWPRKLKEKFDTFIPQNEREATSSWSSFKGKDELSSNLKCIQKGLCAYCEIKLDNLSIGHHLEHIKPKSKFLDRTFDYTNIVLSCFSSENVQSKDPSLSCGHHKLSAFDENLFISPTQLDCNDFFEYDLFGEIYPKEGLSIQDKKKAEYTIELLNLKSYRLLRKRNAIIEETFKIVKELENDKVALDYFLDLEFKEINGVYAFPFINLRKQFLGFLK